MSELKPCPFCDGLASARGAAETHWIKCVQCAAEGPWHKSSAAAVNAWNRRASPPSGVDVAARDVLAEREKQRTKWSAEHDDEHADGSLAAAASVLAHPEVDGVFGPDWAFDLRVKYDNDDRTRRVIAAALLLAEIERLDRRAISAAGNAGSRDEGKEREGG